MMKKLITLIVVFLVLINLVFAINFTVKETETVKLQPEGYDPDSDEVTYNYSAPLDPGGEWETDYGDAGTYEILVTASDGNLTSTETVKLVVEKKEEAPEVKDYVPRSDDVKVKEGGSLAFSVDATDLNDDELSYDWYLDDGLWQSGEENEFSYYPSFFDAGEYLVRVEVKDGVNVVEHEWEVNVEKVDRTKLLDSFDDVILNETQMLVFNLPDFENYNLEYSISEPVGDDGIWKTGYEDSGEYEVLISIQDGDFYFEKEIIVMVENVDRAPIFKRINPVKMEENQKLVITFEAEDPDGDEVFFEALSIPEGVKLIGDKLEWEPDYDTVKKNNIVDKVLDKFHLLSKTFNLEVAAKSNSMQVKQVIPVKVKDVNRAPEIDLISEVYVNEGEDLNIESSGSDPDGDSLSYSYSGWVDELPYTTNYDDAGKHKVIVEVSDGFLKDSTEVIVNVVNVNRVPSLIVNNVGVSEGDNLSINIDTFDLDGDYVDVKVIDLPGGASFKDGKLEWTAIPYDIAAGDEVAEVVLRFRLSDGLDNITENFYVFVHNTNREPKIVGYDPNSEFSIYTNSAVTFKVEAEDPDGDELSYEWEFGLLDKHLDGPVHQRIFTIPGVKNVKVKVSDGEVVKEQVWMVNVLEKAVKKQVVQKPVKQEPVKEVVEPEPVKKVEVVPPAPTPEPIVVPESRTLTFVVEH